MSKDSIYAKPQQMLVDFEFDETVVSVFPDMIRRSVPGYQTLINMTTLLAQRYVQPGSNCYDLGCSVGAATIAIRRHILQADCHIIAVDNSMAMLQECNKNVCESSGNTPVSMVCADIEDINIHHASLVVLNYTLQFIQPEYRLQLMKNIYKGLLPGGLLLLSEKIQFEEPQQQMLQDELHIAFKKANGYSDLEISQKRSALEKVLIPDSLISHENRLKQAGFASVNQWFQCFNFSSIIAIK